jgi:hypothetical protein
MKKYLVVSFSNAKIFRNSSKRDYYRDSGISVDRMNQRYFLEPVTKYQVANMISVFMGERPVPSLRTVAYPRYERAMEIAMESYIRLDPYSYSDPNTGKERFITESCQIRKSADNSWLSTNVTWSWAKIKSVFDNINGIDGSALFKMFTDSLSGYLGLQDAAKVPIKRVRQMLTEKLMGHYRFKNIESYEVNTNNIKKLHRRKAIPEELRDVFLILMGQVEFNGKNIQRGVFLNSFLFNLKNMNSVPGAIRMTQLDICSNVVNLSGELIIPLEESDVEKIRNGDCHATFLDGGLVKFKKLTSGHDISTYGFKKVSEISTETKPFKKNTTKK